VVIVGQWMQEVGCWCVFGCLGVGTGSLGPRSEHSITPLFRRASHPKLMETHRRSEDEKKIWHCGFVSCLPNTILKLVLPLLAHPFIHPGNINWCPHSPPPLFIDPSILRSRTPHGFEVLRMIDSWPCWCSGPIRPRELSPSPLLKCSYQLLAP